MTKKFKRPIAFMLAVIMAMVINLPSGTSGIFDFVKAANAATATQPTSGNGSSSNPYQIGTSSELYWFANYVNSGNTSACAVLTANIKVNTNILSSSGDLITTNLTSWTPIAKRSYYGYTGTFDGKGYTISGLYFNDTSTDYAGLFGYIKADGKVSNVGILDSYFNGSSYVGGISGENYGTITNCYNKGTVSGTSDIGGVSGENYGTITSCYNTGKVNGTNYSTGGVCGRMYGSSASVSKSYNTGAVSGVNWVGGIVGYVNTSCNISSSYNTGNVSGTEAVGGLVGYLSASDTSTAAKISNCYSTASVSGSNYVGGVCGWNYYSTITGTYYDNNVYTGSSVGRNDSGTNSITGKSTNAFKSGEVCYKLNGSTSVGNLTWGQTIGTENSPVLGGEIVYSFNGNYHNHNGDKCEICGDIPKIKDGFYQISDIDELIWFSTYVNSGNTKANAKLTANITLNTGVLASDYSLNSGSFTSWTPIGKSSTYKYNGTFDGQGHTISGLYYYDENSSYVGLFGYLGSNGSISDVNVVDFYFYGQSKVAGVSGVNAGTIRNCYSRGTAVVPSSGYAGGIAGTNSGTIRGCNSAGSNISYNNVGGVCGYNSGTITNCYNTASVNGRGDYIGGICGGIGGGTIQKCYNAGTVDTNTGTGLDMGGICGYMSGGTIQDCYNTGKVNGRRAGGVVGWLYSGTIINCHNIANLTTTDEDGVGGICKQINDGSISNCYYDSSVCSSAVVDKYGGTVGTDVLSKTTTQFKSGEVAYLLQNGRTEYIWGQKIGTEAYPVISTNMVYYSSNTYHNHSDLYCSYCGQNTFSEPQQNNGVYQISNLDELLWFEKSVNSGNTSANAVLTNDIDLSVINNWTPIGNDGNKYTGTFDGQNYTIKNMSITEQGNYSGLFGYTSGATIKNIKITGKIRLTTTSYTEGYGSIVGGALNTDITNCHSSVIMTISKDSTIDSSRSSCIGHIGGIVGKGLKPVGTVSNCSYSGTIELNDRPVNVAAGIVAYCSANTAPTITNCSFTGAINSTNDDVIILGGILGYVNTGNNVNLANCLSAGTITKSGSTSTNGMIIGQINNGYGNNCVINNYYLSSSVSGVGSISETPTTTPATACTQDELNSGRIAYLLSQGTDGSIWGQNLSVTNSFPELNGKKVYKNCVSGTISYSNEDIEYGHIYKNGFCTVCGKYEPPMLNDTYYQIANAGNFNWFADYVNSGNTTVNAVLTADIDFSSNTFTSIGTTDNPFSGIFDGCGYTITVNQSGSDDVAIFGRIGNCTIKNIIVTGTINTSVKNAAGIAMQNVKGYTANIENCISDVTIVSSIDGDGTHGGIIGGVDGTVYINNCAFTGAMTGSNTNCCGGLIGWTQGASTMSNSYIVANFSIDSTGCNTFSRNKGTLNNCYYLNLLDSVSSGATQMTADQFKSGEVCYKLNGSTSEGNLAWGQKIGRDTYPVLGGKTVYYVYNNTTGEYEYANRCNTPDYSNGICSICGDFEEPTQDANSVYQIANAGNLCWFANYVNSGNTTVNAVLIADIDFSSNTFISIGATDNPFSGIFDGCGYTITVNQSGSSDVAIFGCIGNCTIKNLVVDGTINTGEKFAAGIAMQNVEGYTSNIENCISDVTIASSINGDGTHGGIIGVVDGTVNINNCAFTGAMTGSNTDSCGGIIGWTDETSTISNSYVAADFSISSTSCNTFSRYWKTNSVTVTNCYYLNKINTAPSSATQMTADQFKSGEVCYKLNGGVTDGTQAWYQTLVEDTLPKLEGKTVFYNESVDPQYFDAVLGDVSGDDTTNKADAALVLKYAGDIGTLSAKQLTVADVNGDGTVNMLDVVNILNMIA